MKNTFVLSAALIALVSVASTSAGQDQLTQFTGELRKIESAGIQPGSDVVALIATELKSETQTVGHVKKGREAEGGASPGRLALRAQRLALPRIRPSAALVDWYQRMPDGYSVENGGRSRGCFDSIMFEVTNAGSTRMNGNSFGPNSRVNGQRIPSGGGKYINTPNVGIFLRKAGGQSRELMVAFPGSRNIFPVISTLRSRGVIQPGDHVSIDASTRQVVVNGKQRRR